MVYGLALQQLTMPAVGPAAGQDGGLTAAAAPATRAVIDALAAGPGLGLAAMLEPMLDLALDGVETWMSAAGAGPAGE